MPMELTFENSILILSDLTLNHHKTTIWEKMFGCFPFVSNKQFQVLDIQIYSEVKGD